MVSQWASKDQRVSIKYSHRVIQVEEGQMDPGVTEDRPLKTREAGSLRKSSGAEKRSVKLITFIDFCASRHINIICHNM